MNNMQTIKLDLPRRKAGNAQATTRRRMRRDPVSKAVLKIDTLGQVFTPAWLVEKMIALRTKSGRVLEPSCGSGAFANVLRERGNELVALELDAGHAPDYATVGDFFDYPDTEKFETIIGNPPYLRHQDIPAETKAKLDMALFDGRSNLFLFFIEKCVRHLTNGGELIFVVPRDLPKATAARKLNRWLFEQGTITDYWETGDQAVFHGASPPCCIFRFEKGRMTRTMNDGRVFAERDGQLFFQPKDFVGVPLSEFFDVAVGGLTGADQLYSNPAGSLEVVGSETARTGKTCRMLHGEEAKQHLFKHKAALMARGVRTFNESNWWEWGRRWKKSSQPRVYVNALTRTADPFFTHACTAYSGSVLALFPKVAGMDINRAVEILNSVDWNILGFKDGGRHKFAQRSLMTCQLPAEAANKLRQEIRKITSPASTTKESHRQNSPPRISPA
jgi:adenine-specific DNA-methyltransferase